MSPPDALQVLAAWFSPAFPVGGFAYSHGLEAAVAEGVVRDPDSLAAWVEDLLAYGAGRTDAILLAHAFRAPESDDVGDLAAALQPSAERLLEAGLQGAAFAETAAAAWGCLGRAAPYPVAVGRAAAARGLPLEGTITLYLQTFASNQISAGVRLIPIGQTDGQRALARLLTLCRSVAADALDAGLDDLGGVAIRSDIASMNHETQTTRLFRS